MAVIAKRSVMTLFARAMCPESHRIRMVLTEKGIIHETINVDPGRLPEDLVDVNPYGGLPTLIDRDLVVYDSRVICEYLDERFPHPPLMPVDPVSRARVRLAMYRIESDWYSLVGNLESTDEKLRNKTRKVFEERLLSSITVFAAKPYFMNNDFSLADCAVAPILWRLPHYNIELPKDAAPIRRYMDRIFQRSGFKQSLFSEAEKDLGSR